MKIKRAKCSKKFRGKGRFSNRNIRYMMRLAELPPEPMLLEGWEMAGVNCCGLGRETKKVTKEDIIERLEMELSFLCNQHKCIKPEWRRSEREFYSQQNFELESELNYELQGLIE